MKMKLQLVLAVFLLIGTMIWTNCVFVQPPPPGEGGMSVEGWCCRNGDVFPCSEHECYDTGGAFFLYEHEAIAPYHPVSENVDPHVAPVDLVAPAG